MIKLSRADILWIASVAANRRDKAKAKAYMLNPKNKYRDLHALDLESMCVLHDKLETALKKGDKRIEIVP